MLSLRHVSHAFGGLKAVDDVSLDLPQYSLSALIGPNGAGKTTLFALMSGFIKPDSGQVLFRGEDITGRDPKGNSGSGGTEPAAEDRRGFTRVFALGLGPYLADSPIGSQFSLTRKRPDAPPTAATAAKDKWNLWVFSIGSGLNCSMAEVVW